MFKLVPEQGLALVRSDPSSSETPHASCTRSGRVGVGARGLSYIENVAPIVDGEWGTAPPKFIDLPDDTRHVLLERPRGPDGGYEVRSSFGTFLFARTSPTSGAHALARAERFYAGAAWQTWGGKDEGSKSAGYLNPLGELLACAYRGGDEHTLVATPDGQTNHQPIRPDYTHVDLVRPFHARDWYGEHDWEVKFDEPGVGAIDGEGHTVLALPSGRFIILRRVGERGYGILALDAHIGANATDLSIVAPYAMILFGGGDAGALASSRSASRASSHLEARRADGTLAWDADLPFLAGQPPIDGGDRVYVVGRGLVALDLNGAILWSALSPTLLRAQAFNDGTLAVVRGSELQIIAPDGTIRWSFRAQEELTSYPAIASDGAVWVASARALYVVR